MLHLGQMRAALYPTQHNGGNSKSANKDSAGIGSGWLWQRGLPREWRDQVVAPLNVVRHRDYEAVAVRVVGYDENEQACYSQYQYRLSEARSDDDEDFYEETVYAEWGASWRLRDGRWVTYRQVGERGFFSFSEEMPR